MGYLGSLQQGKRPGRGRSQTLAPGLAPPGALIWVPTEGVTVADEVQTVDTDGTGGTFTLTYAGQESGNLAFDITKAAMNTALELLSTVTAVTVTGSDGGPWIIEFTNPGGADIALMTADDTLLTGETVGTTVEETSAGAANVYEVVSFWIDGDTGTFILSYGGQNSATIVYSANAALIDTRLTALSTIADVGVTGAGTLLSPFVVTFADPAGAATAITANIAALYKTVAPADRA